MMSYLFGGLIILSLIFGLLTDNIVDVGTACLESSTSAVEFSLSLLGAICFWSGIMNIADKSGITSKLSYILSPILKWLFPSVKENSPASKAICANISANLLGLGNAITPLGIAAMKELDKDVSNQRASAAMITFVIINTASLQILPTTIAILRSQNGASNPLDILPCVIISSITSLSCGILAVKTFCKIFNKR